MEKVRERRSRSERSQRERDDRLYEEPRPEFKVPTLPKDVTLLSDEELMQHYSEHLAWQNYFASVAAEASARKEEAEEAEKAIGSEFILGSKMKLTEARYARDVDEGVRKYRDMRVEASKLAKRATTQAENRARCVALMSRELTRRTEGEAAARRFARHGQ